jgi:hypothetical protein
MNDINSGIVIEHVDDLNEAAADAAPLNEPFSVAADFLEMALWRNL